MSELQSLFAFFYEKLSRKEYEYAHLPLALKVPLDENDTKAIERKIEGLCKARSVCSKKGLIPEIKGQAADQKLLETLQMLNQALRTPGAESHMIKNPQVNP